MIAKLRASNCNEKPLYPKQETLHHLPAQATNMKNYESISRYPGGEWYTMLHIVAEPVREK